MWIRAFTTGTHRDGAGNFNTWTREQLDTMASKFKSRGLKIPACIGHPEKDAPAYGWFDQVKREGDDLNLHLGEISPKFAEAVRDTHYKYVSLALRPDLSIRHVGFLGAEPPAINLGELKKHEFSEGLEGIQTFEFADYHRSTLKRLFQGLRELLLLKFGQEEADRALSQWDVERVGEAENVFSEPLTPTEEITVTVKTPEQFQAEIDELKRQNNQLQTEGSTTKTQLTALQFSQNREKDKTFILGLGTKVLPGRVEQLTDFMGALREKGELTFSEGGKKNALEEFKGFLQSLPEQLTFGEGVTTERAAGTEADEAGPASKKITQLVDKKMEKDDTLDFSAASKLVFSENPELAKAYTLELQAKA